MTTEIIETENSFYLKKQKCDKDIAELLQSKMDCTKVVPRIKVAYCGRITQYEIGKPLIIKDEKGNNVLKTTKVVAVWTKKIQRPRRRQKEDDL